MAETHSFIVIGLGNPGESYQMNRHNTGRLILEKLANELDVSFIQSGKYNAHIVEGEIGATPYTIALPNTYMNKSGSSVQKLVTSMKAAERLIVVYDDLDLPWGTVRVAFERGSGGHNGIESIIKALKTKKFIRIRVGVAPVTPEGKVTKPRGEAAVLKYLMSDFTKKELGELAAIKKTVLEALTLIMTKGRQQAMNTINSI